MITDDDVEKAIDYLREHPIDIIISDMRMPIMNGAEFFTHAKDIQPNAIRILLTGYSDMETTIQDQTSVRDMIFVAKR